jgi:hypothetical protein
MYVENVRAIAKTLNKIMELQKLMIDIISKDDDDEVERYPVKPKKFDAQKETQESIKEKLERLS